MLGFVGRIIDIFQEIRLRVNFFFYGSRAQWGYQLICLLKFWVIYGSKLESWVELHAIFPSKICNVCLYGGDQYYKLLYSALF